jgi:DNA-binding transcriptional regulator YiaG
MSDSRFWKSLAKMFRALHVNSRMRAEWRYTVGSEPKEWKVTETSGIARIRFEALARRAARALSDAGGGSDLLVAWLEALQLRLVSGRSILIMAREGTELNDDGTDGACHKSGMIWRVCEASAQYCDERESRAREAELGKKLQAQEDRAKASEIVRSSGESIGHQIDRLRKEARLTIEALAGKVNFNVRTVQKHIADDRVPLGRTLTAYERVFSKSLNRTIVIKNKP